MSDTAPPPPTEADDSQLLRIWLSPSFPVGSFAYSHGLEQAAAHGLVASRDGLVAWLEALLDHGSARTDLVLLAAAWRAARLPDTVAGGAELAQVNGLALAVQPSAERHLETAQQGTSFIATCAAAWPCAAVRVVQERCGPEVAYPVALGAAAAGHDIALSAVLDAAALAFVQALVSAAIRLSLVGQTDGQRVIAALLPAIARASGFAREATLDDLGTACFSSDLASLEHETLSTRLFRS